MKSGHWKRYFYYCGSYSWYSQCRGRPGNKKLSTWIYLWLYSKISKFYPSVDLLASRINTQLTWFFAYRWDPKAEVINAFCVSWRNFSFYCFPPFSCIGKVLQKIISDNATGIFIVQTGRASFGLPSYKTHYCQKHLSFHLMQNSTKSTWSQAFFFFRNLELMASLVSGKALASSSTYPVGF